MDRKITKQIQQGKMTRFQVVAITICLMINMMDGFDVLAIAFAAPGIAAEFNLSASSLGVVFSAGFLGMMLGSLFLAPMADKIGRKNTIMICLIILSIGMFASALAASVEVLTVMRFITGIGIGAMLASLNTIVAEYSSDQRRALAVTFMQSGYPIGAVLGGIFTSSVLLTYFDWRAIFIFGGVSSLIILPFVSIYLPESISFLLHQRPSGALNKINLILKKINQPLLVSIDQLSKQTERPRVSAKVLLTEKYRVKTIMLTVAFFLACMSIYFILSWLPKVIVDIGLTAKNGVTSGVLMNLGGVIGAWMLGYMVSKKGLGKIMVIGGSVAALLVTLMGFVDADLRQILPMSVILGFFMFGTMAGFYVSLPSVFPPEIRATGSGWVIGLGRLGAVVGPFVAGLLIQAEFTRPQYFFMMSIPFLVAGLIMMRLPKSAF